MKVLRAYTKGWSRVFRHKGIWGLMYLANLGLALFAAIPFSGFLGRTVGHSPALGKSLPGFDYTFIGEMLQNYGLQIDRLLDRTYFSIFIFLLVSIFLTGGALHIYRNNEMEFSWEAFWLGCRKYFWRLFRLAIYFLIVHGVLLFLFFAVFSSMSDGLNPFQMESEKQMLDAFMILGPFYLLCFTLVTMIHDYAKIHVVQKDERWLYQPFWDSFRITFKNIGRFLTLYCLNILTFLLTFGLYWWGSSFFEAIHISEITLLLIIGQLFIIARVAIRLVFWSSATYLYQWTKPGHVT